MKKGFANVCCALAVGLLCSCSTPWTTNTPRSAIEQYLTNVTVERGVACADFSGFEGKKAFLDYDYLAPQVDKAYVQGVTELRVAQSGLLIVRKLEEADLIVQVLCPVLGTNFNKVLIGTPELPIPIPTVDISFAIPEIAIFSKYTRSGHGRFTFNVYEAKTRRLLKSSAMINASAYYHDWIIFFIPFRSTDMPMQDTAPVSIGDLEFELF